MLTDEQAAKLQDTIFTAGWKEIIEPALTNRARAALKALSLEPAERAKAGGDFKDATDTMLREVIRECEWMLAVWLNELKVHRMNQQLNEQNEMAVHP